MKTLEIAVIHRVENGWLVTVPNSSYSKNTYLCVTWEDVEKRTKDAAFFYSDYTKMHGEPRMP